MEKSIEITIQADVKATMENVWASWNEPEHVVKWNTADESWHTPKAENDFRVGGSFCYRMEAKDGSMGFDFEGVYEDIKEKAYIATRLGDNRSVKTTFTQKDGYVEIVEVFEAEGSNPVELQKNGWQSILDNFKAYTEKL